MGGVYSYDCSFGHVPNVELMKFIAMATFGAYLSTCPELDPLSLDLNVYHKAFLLYSFLRTGESLNPEYYCGEECACPPSSRWIDVLQHPSLWGDSPRLGYADALPCPLRAILSITEARKRQQSVCFGKSAAFSCGPCCTLVPV